MEKKRGFFEGEKKDFKNVFGRIRRRNFSGETGQAVKNSSYQLTQKIVMKIGSLFFTIILARLLMPEKMGIYSLALSTIVLFAAFSDLGIGSAIITYISKNKKNPRKAKGYWKKLLYWKLFLLSITSFVLLLSSYFIANNYYNKPIFYALLAGAIYLPIVGLLGFFEQTFKADNNFKIPLIKEIIFQTSRFILVPLGVLLLLNINLSVSLLVLGILVLLILSYFIAFIYILFRLKKRVFFLNSKSEDLNKNEILDLKRFILPLSATALSGMFFGYIDIIMLGHYISGEFISYYQVAFSLVGSAAAILGFTAIALFPLFSRLKGIDLERLFRKSRNFTLLISFFAAIFTYFTGYWIIKLAYGSAYLSAVPILKLLSILVFILPLLGFYVNYYVSQKRTKTIMWLLLTSTFLNIVFNFVGITYGLAHYGFIGAIFGATIATILSRLIYFVGLVSWRKR